MSENESDVLSEEQDESGIVERALSDIQKSKGYNYLFDLSDPEKGHLTGVEIVASLSLSEQARLKGRLPFGFVDFTPEKKEKEGVSVSVDHIYNPGEARLMRGYGIVQSLEVVSVVSQGDGSLVIRHSIKDENLQELERVEVRIPHEDWTTNEEVVAEGLAEMFRRYPIKEPAADLEAEEDQDQ